MSLPIKRKGLTKERKKMIKKAIGVYAISVMSILGAEQENRKVDVPEVVHSRASLTIENDARTIRTTVIIEKRTPYRRVEPKYNHEPRKLTPENITKNPEQYREFAQYIHDIFLQQDSHVRDEPLIFDLPGLVSQRKQYVDVVKKKMTEMKSKKEDLQNTDPFLAPPKVLPWPQPHLLDPLNLVDYKDETEKGK